MSVCIWAFLVSFYFLIHILLCISIQESTGKCGPSRKFHSARGAKISVLVLILDHKALSKTFWTQAMGHLEDKE